MRSIVSILFLFLANIVILVHAVIPHHHHNRFFVSVVSMFDTELLEFLDHSHNADVPGYHDGSTNKTVILFSQIQKECKNNISTQCFCYANNLFIDNDNTVPPDLYLSGLPYIYKPYIEIYHTDCFVKAKSLRAPPFC